MNLKFYDIIVAKEFNTITNGQPTRKTAWNRVGRAWKSKDTENLNIELFLIPNQRYVVFMKEQDKTEPLASFEDAPF